MKKLIIKSLHFTLYFAIFFVLINALYLVIIISTDWDFKNRLESLKFENPDFDLLVIGASTSFDGFDTELLSRNGVNSYNLAMGGTSLKTNIIQMEEYISNYSKKPEIVVLGLNSELVQTFDIDEIHPIIEVTMVGHKYNLNDAPILKFKWLGFELLKKLVSKSHREAKLSLGQLRFKKTIPDKTEYKDLYLDLNDFESSYWLGEIVKFCAQENLRLIIIEMPGYKETQNLSDRGPYNLSFANGYSASLFNYNNREFCEIFDPEKDWIGNSHLNEYGAIKFTNEIIKLLNENHQSIEN